MAIGVTLFVIIALIVLIWVLIETKRFKHKMFAWFLIGLLLFGYLSFSYVMRNQDVDFGTISGFLTAGKIYFSWLGSIFGNFKSMTTNAIKMNWSVNKTEKVDVDHLID